MILADRLAGASTDPVWWSPDLNGPALPPLGQDGACDLAIIGGGFTGLWCALKARERSPDQRIVVLEAKRCGGAASGRNGGFCAPSISHGISNALARWPREADTLVRLGFENLNQLEEDLDAYGIEAEFERSGKLTVAATPWQAEGLKAMQAGLTKFGRKSTYLEGQPLDALLNTPAYQAGLWDPNYALVNPSRIVAGLRRACLERGIEIHEETPARSLKPAHDGVTIHTPRAHLRAARVALATNAAVPLLKRLRMAIIPIYDYSLVTEPLSDAQLEAIGWVGRYGIADSGNQFHYARKTADNRILWAGYDAIYHFGSDRGDARLQRAESFARLMGSFDRVFPSLSSVRFSHAWGGIIDTSARTTFFAGTAFGGRLAYALGFTGQGVSASRFGALTMLDLLDGRDTERTSLAMSRSWPVPFPPEPLRYLAIRWAQRDLAREDLTGHRSLMLRTLDRLGIGFAS
ncbi:MAG: FAD-dependent oxidoreductase [Hoeflea sp.]|uniref:NAD(P)/FAD-dependent oxidoreductase n=1 Tax=Hoeflea sp. TaxID=1940281 RepID=UPI00272F1A25|nr:FAD-dependent oxidoreductase [Hoeflea sp.]MDP2119136.1 FAD-dependent oxidoreductase [Hoeflea sp.]